MRLVGGDHTDIRDNRDGAHVVVQSDRTIAVEVGDNHEGKELHQEEVTKRVFTL